MKVPVAKIAANVVARVHPAGMAALAAASVVREDRGDVALKALARVVRVAMDLGRRAKAVRAVAFPAMTGGNQWNGANRRNRCRKSWRVSFRTKRALNPWRAR